MGVAAGVGAGDRTPTRRHPGDLALVDALLDAAAHEARIERVVAGVDAQVGIRWHAQDDPRIEVGELWQQWAHRRPLLAQAIDRPAARWVGRLARSRNQRSSWSAKSISLANRRPGSKLVSNVALQAHDETRLAFGSAPRTGASPPGAGRRGRRRPRAAGPYRRAGHPRDSTQASVAGRPGAKGSGRCR